MRRAGIPAAEALLANRMAELLPEITAWRRDFHENPELLYEVHRTAGKVAELLRTSRARRTDCSPKTRP